MLQEDDAGHADVDQSSINPDIRPSSRQPVSPDRPLESPSHFPFNQLGEEGYDEFELPSYQPQP